MAQDLRQADVRLSRVRQGLLLALGVFVLIMPLSGSVDNIYFRSSLSPGPRLYLKLADFMLNGLLPSLVVNAALVALFPAWRILRVALPSVAALTVIGWAAWLWMFIGPVGKQDAVRWSLVAGAGPLGIVTATVFIFFLARARRPVVPRG